MDLHLIPHALSCTKALETSAEKLANRLARLQCAAMREGMRSDLLSGAGRNQPRKARAEMIRIAPLVRTDILQPRNFGPFAGGKFCPGQELVFALAEKRPDRRPGRPDAAPLKQVEHGRDRFSSPQHIRPVALARCVVPDAPHQLIIERDDEIAGHAARRAHAARMHRRVSSGQPKSLRETAAERGLSRRGPDGSNSGDRLDASQASNISTFQRKYCQLRAPA